MQRREYLQTLFALACAGTGLGGCASLDDPSRAARSALAPTGRLRVAFLNAPLYATRATPSAEMTGVAIDLGRALAERLGVPFEPVVHAGATTLMAGARSGEWDVVLTGITAERAVSLDFSAPYLQVEWGALARADAAVADAPALDRPGLRLGLVERTFGDTTWGRTLKHATPVRAASLADLLAMLDSGRADVIVATKATLAMAARTRAGTRPLEGSLFVEPIGMAVPKGRDAAAARYVSAFVEQAKAGGRVAEAIVRAGLQGVSVAPLG